jgi:hypothetical protein
MKRLFYMTGSLCFLAIILLIGFHLGHSTAIAQGNGETAAIAGEVVSIATGPTAGDVWFATSSGDVYRRSSRSGELEYHGNLRGINSEAP